MPDDERPGGLRRTLGVRDLVALSIGAVIGAGIFSSIGTAAAGQILPDGTVVRYGAGPGLVLSFALLGAVCALAALCYAELSAMIPQAGSAYAYSYATLGEIIAWIIGWDLILEYAVGNVAVAIGWSGYFNSLLTGVGIKLPAWMVHGYREVMLSSDPALRGLLDTAPHRRGHARAAQRARLLHRRAHHGAARPRRARKRARQQRPGRHQAARARDLRDRGRAVHRYGELQALRAERLPRHLAGRRDRVLRLHRLRRDLDGGRGNEEPAAEYAVRHPARARDLHGDLHHRRRRGHGVGAVPRARWRTIRSRRRST